MTNENDRQLDKIAIVLVAMLVVFALWEQFAPKTAPGKAELIAAQALLQSDSASDHAKACELFGAAVREGNREAAFGLSDCIAKRDNEPEQARRVLRYAVLTLALQNPIEGRDAQQERAALGCSPQEVAQANELDVMRILLGEISPWDYAFSAWSR